jgi:ABC-type oligopeptide transport system substrate-binding subunit/class 3 adenylate cyclase/tetratricopeptide (TPR) repeat protein
MARPTDQSGQGLPEGTVTFLFTDIEGSTQLLHRLGQQYVTLLADHHRILREIFAQWHGREVDTEGDAFFVSFARATEAVAAVVEAQRALTGHAWPEGVSVRVRMGLHTGEPWTAQAGYVGMDVHRAARIAHVGYGGQALLSETTAPLVLDELPEGVSLLDLGRHRLKDMKRPERIRQLVIEGLPSEFPPLKSLGVVETAGSGPWEPIKPPAFLQEPGDEVREPVFVGRERELSWLDNQLSLVLQGQGGVAFVSGDAGSGKSTLLNAFARQASAANPDMLVAWGACNAFSGRGDPYLPFRDVLSSLTGDVERSWTAGSLTTGQARALWSVISLAIQGLLDHAPDLLDTMVPLAPLLARAESAFPPGHPVLSGLAERASKESLAGDLEQPQLFEQAVELLHHLARERPLLIILDDLQWADGGSVALLFHLGRRLAGGRILVLGAYRQEEVTVEAKHPLRSLLDEFRRAFGDVWLDLNQAPGRAFVDALVDSEANRLDEGFRETLFQRTGGHPLFTVELLRDMQERGDLVKDEGGAWTVGPELDWEALPARVEGAIEARIGRLEEELRDILAVAAVEGEAFTAQVVARVQEIQERQLLRILSRELQKRYKLVQEERSERTGRQMINRYRFVHHVFQRYIYNGLTSAERQLLHSEVGAILETLFEDKNDEMIVQLARHFDEAGESEKAAGYLLAAGDRARSLYANQEAIAHYQRALEHFRQLGDDERLARTWMRLGLTYHNAFYYRRSRQAYDQGFAVWQRVSLAPQERGSEVNLRLWQSTPESLDPPFTNDTISGYWVRQLFSGLVEISDEMVVVPDVARRWEIRNGGLTYIFHLRQDAKWSDGQPVTAGDFILAWRRMLDPRTSDRLAERLFDVKGAKSFHQGGLSDESQLGLRALDDITLMVELEQPASYFLHLLATESTFPVPQHMVEKLGDRWAEPESIVTNGPFMIESWSPDELVRLARNPYYYGAYGGNVSQVEVSLRDFTDLLEKAMDPYARGDVDILEATWILSDSFRSVLKRYGEYYVSIPELTTVGIAFNQQLPPLDDIRVRRALAMAIDQEHFVRVFLQDQAAPALGGWIPHGLPGHSPDIGLHHDPATAWRLLVEAGYPEGRSFPPLDMVWFESPINRKAGNYISQVWRDQLGINISPMYIPFSEWMDLLERPDRPAIIMKGWAADFPDPDNFLRTGLHEILRTNRRVLEKIEAARILTDQGERLTLYQEADKILIEEALIVPLAYNLGHFFISPRVRKFPLTQRWRDIIVDPDRGED